MKKRVIIIAGIILLCMLLVGGMGMYFMSAKSLSVSTGRCIAGNNGRYLVMFSYDPAVMSNRTNNENLFADLQTGDKIWILHGPIAETYPAQIGVYAYGLLEKGGEADIPADIMKSLAELGCVNLAE